MTQVETNVIQAMANAGDVDQTLQNHVLKLVVAHDKAVANYKTAIKTCRKLEAQLEDAKATMVQLKDIEQYSKDLEAAMKSDCERHELEFKDAAKVAKVDLTKKVDKLEEKW